MNLPRRFPRFQRVAVFAAALALALSPPTGPGVLGTPGAGEPAAPADVLRAGQALGTSVGLEELPRELGHAPESAPAVGLEEDWHEALGRLPAAGRFRSLAKGEATRIPLKALRGLPKEIPALLVYLADERHILLLHPTLVGLRVSVKGILAVPKTLELGKPLLVGRTLASDPAEQRLVLPDTEPWRVVSGDHVKLELVKDVKSEIMLHLTHVSGTNGTYLSNEQVSELLQSPAGGLEEGAAFSPLEDLSPAEAWRFFNDEILPDLEHVRVTLRDFPDRIHPNISEFSVAKTGERLEGILSDLPETARLTWEPREHGAWTLRLAPLPFTRALTLRRLAEVCRFLAHSHAEGWEWDKAVWDALTQEESSHRGADPRSVGRTDLITGRMGTWLLHPGTQVWVTDAVLAGAPTWLVAAAAVAEAKDQNLTMMDAVPREIAGQEVMTQLQQDAVPSQPVPVPDHHGDRFLELVLDWVATADHQWLDGRASTQPDTGPSTELGTGLEEVAGEELRFVVVAPPPVASALTRTARALTAAREVMFAGGPPMAGERPADVVLVGLTVEGEYLEASAKTLQAGLAGVAQYGPDTSRASVGIIIVAPRIAFFLNAGNSDTERKARDAVRDAVRASFPSATYAVVDRVRSQEDKSIEAVVHECANAALDRRRGGLPAGRIFNPKTPEFLVLTAALVQQAMPDSRELVNGLLGQEKPLALDAAGGDYARVALAVLGEPVPDTTLADLGPPAMAGTPPPDPQPQFVWQLEEAVRRRVLAMDAAALAELNANLASVAFSGSSEAVPTSWAQAVGSATNELSQLQTRAELVEFLQALNDGRPVGPSLWRIGVMWAPTKPSWSWHVEIMREDRGLSAWEQAVLKRFAVRVTLTAPGPSVSVERPLTVNAEGAYARFPLEMLEMSANEMGLAMEEQRLRVKFIGPGLPAAEAGLEEATVEQAARTEADPTLDWYY